MFLPPFFGSSAGDSTTQSSHQATIHACRGFTTRFDSRGAHGCEEQCHARGTRVYTGPGLREDSSPPSCVHRCIIIR
jgi:hypothetical protein